jgi:hypothetical protein
MPQIQQFQTGNTLACWQGVGGSPLTIRSAFQCVLTRISTGHYNLAINVDLDDEDTQVEVDPQDGFVYSIRIVWNTNGTADIFFTQSGDIVDPGLFNIWVAQCTDFVSAIEGPPGNP